MFYGLASGAVDTKELDFEHELQGIQELRQAICDVHDSFPMKDVESRLELQIRFNKCHGIDHHQPFRWLAVGDIPTAIGA